MAEQRLPVVNGDDGQWGSILNQFLGKEHYNDGTDNPVNGGHQTITVRPGTTTAGTAPLKFTSGNLLTTPEPGAVEFYSDSLYVTQTTGATRKKVAAYDDSSGATGDLYYRDSSGYFVRLPIGTSTNVLTVSGGLPTWVPASGGGGGSTRSIATISTNTAAGSTAGTDYVYFIATTGVTLTLPTAVASTNLYTIKNTSADVVSVTTTASQTIDGTVGPINLIPEQSIDVLSDNANWQIV
jgi:hypothetical protein